MSRLKDLFMETYAYTHGFDVDEDTPEPAYHTWKDDDGVIHIEVGEGLGEFVIWDVKEGRMVKKYDRNLLPF